MRKKIFLFRRAKFHKNIIRCKIFDFSILLLIKFSENGYFSYDGNGNVGG